MAKFSYKDRGQGEACYFAYAMDGTINQRLGRPNVYLIRCSTPEDAIYEKDRLKHTVGHTGQKMNVVGTITKKTMEYVVKDYFRKVGKTVASVRTVEVTPAGL